MADNMLGWFQAGANIVAQGQQNRFQQQQLKAQESDRAIRERLLAQQIAQIDLANQQRQAELTRRAEEDAQWLQVNTDITKQQAALKALRDAGVQVPQFDPTSALDEAAMRLAGSNPNAQRYLASRAQVENFRGDMARRQALENPPNLEQRAKELNLEPSDLDAQGRLTYARPRATEEMTVTPEGVTIKKGGNTVTTATQTKMEQAESSSLQTAARARRLLPLLSPENVGPRGLLTRTAEAVAGTVIPDYKVGSAIEAVTVARQFKSGLIDMLKSDSNISVKEVEAIEGALPQPDKFITASNQEKVKLAATLEDVGQLSRNNARLRGKPINPIWLMPSEIDARLKAGEITEEEAVKLLEGNMWIFVALIRQKAQSQ